MIVLGIDPGLTVTGFAILSTKNDDTRIIDYGTIEPNRKDTLSKRLYSIYADIEGRIFDPLNGISDLQNGIIKFIGSPKERIQEDYLRILRYFRFFIQYGKTDHDRNIIGSIKQYINGINKISNERR